MQQFGIKMQNNTNLAVDMNRLRRKTIIVGKFVDKRWICAVDRNGDEATNQSENGDFERLRGGVLDSGYGTADRSFRKLVIADTEVRFNIIVLLCWPVTHNPDWVFKY